MIWFDLPRFGKSPSRGKTVKRWWMPVFSKASCGERQAFSVQEPQEWLKSVFLMTRNFPHYRLDLNWPGTVRGGLQALQEWTRGIWGVPSNLQFSWFLASPSLPSRTPLCMVAEYDPELTFHPSLDCCINKSNDTLPHTWN